MEVMNENKYQLDALLKTREAFGAPSNLIEQTLRKLIFNAFEVRAK